MLKLPKIHENSSVDIKYKSYTIPSRLWNIAFEFCFIFVILQRNKPNTEIYSSDEKPQFKTQYDYDFTRTTLKLFNDSVSETKHFDVAKFEYFW